MPAQVWRTPSRLMAGLLDLGAGSFIAGRSAAAMHGLDGFRRQSAEFLVPRRLRGRTTNGLVVATTRPVGSSDVCRINGLRCVRVERIILDAPLFGFTPLEIENAIDSGLRLGLFAEERLRQRVASDLSPGVNGGRVVIDALVDAGGHSQLERRFLRLVREAGLPRPQLQVTYRAGTRVVAHVDAQFGSELVVEVAGHATHSTRRQRQIDEQRRTELTLRGKRVLTFTYEDVTERPDWTADRFREALSERVA